MASLDRSAAESVGTYVGSGVNVGRVVGVGCFVRVGRGRVVGVAVKVAASLVGRGVLIGERGDSGEIATGGRAQAAAASASKNKIPINHLRMMVQP